MRVLVAGAGMVGRRLIARLSADRHDVVALDVDRDTCEMVASKLGVVTVCGNATDVTTLDQAEATGCDVAVALMRSAADNLAFALLVRGAGVPRVIARMPNPEYRTAYEHAGVTSLIDTTGLFLEHLLLEVERPDIQRVTEFASGSGVAVNVRIPKGSRVIGKTISEVYVDRSRRHSVLIAAVERSLDGALVIPVGPERLREDDVLLLVGKAAEIEEAVDYFGIRQGWLARRWSVGRRAAEEPDESTQVALDRALEGPEPSSPED
ncbi:MAG: TrkA family potassium uptake protein [Candidatus Bipolaricaulota bacterium]|nr:MAG: TrkA family potassium uptake protein [Candidatus Bipolaricaulota bacterium]